MTKQTQEDAFFAAWDRLRLAIVTVECVLPDRMSEAMEALTNERWKFEDLILDRKSQ